MKIRCTNQSLRMRIRKSELMELAENKGIVETLSFPNGTSLEFKLSIRTISKVTSSFSDSCVEVSLPESLAREWIHSNQVGIQHNEKSKKDLEILVEKDFPCPDRPNEDKSDTFWELSQESC